VRAAAQGLCAREQEHQRRIVRRTRLDRPPRQIVKGLVFAAIRGGKGHLSAFAPLPAADVSR